jgi:hypothetical protein
MNPYIRNRTTLLISSTSSIMQTKYTTTKLTTMSPLIETIQEMSHLKIVPQASMQEPITILKISAMVPHIILYTYFN